MNRKFLLWLPIMLLLCSASMACAAETHYQLQVDGLACPFCIYGIEKNLLKINGVKEVIANLEEGSVYVRVGDASSVSEAQFRKVITEAGFTLKSVETELRESPQ